MSGNEDGSKPFCPGCGREYDVKYPKQMFTPDMIEPEDSLCRGERYVHVHKA